MSELKHHLMLNKERSWVPVYLKSEADKVIAWHKYKRCLAMAVICFNRAERANCWKEEVKSRKRFEKWLKLAQKFKEAK